MPTWGEFAAAQPEMAAIGEALLQKHMMAYLATVRPDGGPRLHPVSPFIIDGRLYVATKRTSPKARDQIRDPRYVLHFLPGENDDEFVIRGHAREVVEPGERTVVQEKGPHYVHAEDHYFEYGIDHAMTAYWENVGKPGTYPVRRSWSAP